MSCVSTSPLCGVGTAHRKASCGAMPCRASPASPGGPQGLQDLGRHIPTCVAEAELHAARDWDTEPSPKAEQPSCNVRVRTRVRVRVPVDLLHDCGPEHQATAKAGPKHSLCMPFYVRVCVGVYGTRLDVPDGACGVDGGGAQALGVGLVPVERRQRRAELALLVLRGGSAERGCQIVASTGLTGCPRAWHGGQGPAASLRAELELELSAPCFVCTAPLSHTGPQSCQGRPPRVGGTLWARHGRTASGRQPCTAPSAAGLQALRLLGRREHAWAGFGLQGVSMRAPDRAARAQDARCSAASAAARPAQAGACGQPALRSSPWRRRRPRRLHPPPPPPPRPRQRLRCRRRPHPPPRSRVYVRRRGDKAA
jgi:hypothetical protein